MYKASNKATSQYPLEYPLGYDGVPKYNQLIYGVLPQMHYESLTIMSRLRIVGFFVHN